MRRLALAALLALLGTAGCRTGDNYESPGGPRWAGPPPPAATPPAPARPETLRVVSFNVEFAVRVDSAIAVLAGEPALRGADVVLLQEMDEEGTRRVAEALGMGWVYYPALRSRRTGRGFGNAVLSRWPIVEDAKLVLPHRGFLVGTRRAATAATIRVGDREVRVYSTHLGTMVNRGPGARRAQLRAVLADAARFPRVIVGGDMNSHGVGKVARASGYLWPTERGPRTARFGRWDHVFLRGLAVPEGEAAGTVLEVRGSSDHRPVWTLAILP